MKAKRISRDELRKWRYQTPFQPFRIITRDGERYKVGQPFAFAFNDSRIVITPRPGPWRPLKYADVERVEAVKSKN